MVVQIDIKTHNTFFPVLSITKPKNGLATAEIMYTTEFTMFASEGVKLNFVMKKFLKIKKKLLVFLLLYHFS